MVIDGSLPRLGLARSVFFILSNIKPTMWIHVGTHHTTLQRCRDIDCNVLLHVEVIHWISTLPMYLGKIKGNTNIMYSQTHTLYKLACKAYIVKDIYTYKYKQLVRLNVIANRMRKLCVCEFTYIALFVTLPFSVHKRVHFPLFTIYNFHLHMYTRKLNSEGMQWILTYIYKAWVWNFYSIFLFVEWKMCNMRVCCVQT